MNYLYLFILLSFSNIIIGQSNRYDWGETNYINNGSRSQIITLLKDGTPLNGIVGFNGAELKCENGRVISETHYWRNGNISSYYELKDGLYHGNTVLYYKNGNKSLVGKYAYGEFDGLGRGYRKNGLLYFEEFQEDGFLIAGRYYDKKGNLKREESTLKSITMAKLGIDIFSEEAIDFERNNFETIIIGNQEWMTKNLNVDSFRNGDPILEIQNKEEWVKAGDNKQPAWCYYDNDSLNGQKFGKLYNWYAVNDSRGIAPHGYHIPSDAEWTLLTEYLGGRDIAGEKMKSTTGWALLNGSNDSGFSGLPCGSRGEYGTFWGLGGHGYWWSSTEFSFSSSSTNPSSRGSAWTTTLDKDDGEAFRGDGFKLTGFSVRCIQD